MMTLDVVNDQNEKVDSLDLDSTVFGGVVNTGLIWESVVHQNASERSGTAATKTRGKVRGSGKKPWRQKGTGRARVGSVRNPIWRSGGTVFGPTPRDYGYALPHKMKLGALQAAVKQQIATNSLIVVDRLAIEEAKTMNGAILEKLGHIPANGTEIELGGYTINIIQTKENAIKTLKIKEVDPKYKLKAI